MVAATNNGDGVAAVNWNGRVLPVRVAGKCGADPRDIVDGMLWAAGLQACKVYDANGNCTENAPINPNPARVVNISFGGTGGCEPYQADHRSAGHARRRRRRGGGQRARCGHASRQVSGRDRRRCRESRRLQDELLQLRPRAHHLDGGRRSEADRERRV